MIQQLSGLTLVLIGVGSQACAPAADRATTSTDVVGSPSAATAVSVASTGGSVDEPGIYASSQGFLPTSDFTTTEDPAAQATVNLPPLLVVGSFVSINIDYEEKQDGSALTSVTFRPQDPQGSTELRVGAFFELGKAIAISPDGIGAGMQLTIDGVEHTAIEGSMQLTLADGTLHWDFADLVFEGIAETGISGSIRGVPVESCIPLVARSGAATNALGEYRVQEGDPTWSSAFCSSIPRLFP